MAYAFDTPLITNDQSIDRVLNAGLPVALVFSDGEARPDFDDMLRRLAREHAGKLLVVKVNVKDSPAAARRYKVARTPAIVALRDKQPLSRGEAIGAKEAEAHALFLLGQGPRPVENGAQAHAATAKPGARQGQPVVVTDGTFDELVLRSPEPVLVDFWAAWCGPCRMIEPAVENIAHENAGRLRVAKVNVDENPGLSARYDVRSIPTMMVVKGGQIVERWAGAMPEPALKQRVLRWAGA